MLVTHAFSESGDLSKLIITTENKDYILHFGEIFFWNLHIFPPSSFRTPSLNLLNRKNQKYIPVIQCSSSEKRSTVFSGILVDGVY